ncbi:MAG TPA: hypothetical protein VFH51_13955 [Myxococcota bacterium]|nr:hypothetical protein [Myxococcota bacterium]
MQRLHPITALLSGALVLTSLLACGGEGITLASPPSRELSALTGGMTGRAEVNGQVYDILNGRMAARHMPPSSACAEVFGRIDATWDVLLTSIEYDALTAAVQREGVFEKLGALQHADCGGTNPDPRADDPPACAGLRTALREALAGCQPEIDAWSALPGWEGIRAGIRGGLAAGCYGSHATG